MQLFFLSEETNIHLLPSRAVPESADFISSGECCFNAKFLAEVA